MSRGYHPPMSLVTAGAAAFVTVAAIGWWRSLRPSNDRDWRPEVARLATAEIDGERVKLRNVRNFRYRSVEDFDERWEDRTYDLSRLDGLDIFFIYWGAPLIAHTILSWSFDDGQRLAISVEVRKRKGQKYSAWKAFFRVYELIYVAADEQDLIKLRTNYRREQVWLYRVRTSQAGARSLLVDYLEAMNQIARRPIWYNALLSNCTTVIRQRVIHAGGRLPFSWRYFANASLPELLHRRGVIDARLPFEELKAKSHINPRALKLGEGDDFSAGIREGLCAMPLKRS
jgi:Domain of unknown function (DUF4105)